MVNFDKLRLKYKKPSALALVSEYDNFAGKILNLGKLITILPDEWDYSLFTSYVLMPSALTSLSPILFLHGESGSGKSKLLSLAAKIYDAQVFSASSTFAAIRNEIERGKWTYVDSEFPDDDGGYYREKTEKNIIFCFDDLDPRVFVDQPNIFRLLKTGCDRTTSTIVLVSPIQKDNERFDCYCNKVITSIHDFEVLPKYKELSRRMLKISFKPLAKQQKTTDNKQLELSLENDASNEVLNEQLYDWGELSDEYINFWDKRRSLYFLETVQAVLTNKRIKKCKLTKVPMIVPVIASMHTIELHPHLSLPLLIDRCLHYLYEDERARGDKDEKIALKLLDDYVINETHSILTFNDTNKKTLNIEIELRTINQLQNNWIDQGLYSQKLTLEQIRRFMIQRGFSRDKGSWIKEDIRQHDHYW